MTFLLRDPAAGTSNELVVQNEWEENTHTIPTTVVNGILNYFSMSVYAWIHQQDTSDGVSKYRAIKSRLILEPLVVVVVVFTLKPVLTSIQYLLFLALQDKETNFRGHIV